MLTIVWDVDDVLNDLMYQWFSGCWIKDHPGSNASYTALTANPPDRVLNIPREEYLDSLDRFRKTERAINMEPNREVLRWMLDQGSQFRHLALTARPIESAPDVGQWVLRHFGAWIRCVGFVQTRPRPDLPAYDRTKGEFLGWLRCGDIMVDDSPENIAQAQSLGMRTLLYPQPWNDSSLSVPMLLNRLSEMAVNS